MGSEGSASDADFPLVSPRRWRPGPLLALVAACLCLSWSNGPVRAVVRFAAEDALARASAAAVRGRVLAVQSRRDAAVDAIYTHVRLAVRRAWGFPATPAVLDLKLLGGTTADGTLAVGGQARFTVGEEVLVFVDVRPRDATLSVTGLERGKWTVAPDGDAAVRGWHEATGLANDPVVSGAGAAPGDPVAIGEVEALATLAGTAVRVPPHVRLTTGVDAMGAASDRAAATDGSDLLPDRGRWHEADWGAPVFVDSMANGHPLFPGGGFTQLLRAIDAWSASSALRLQPGVLRGPRCFAGGDNADGRISVSYGDPCDEIADASPTLAIGGAYYASGDVRLVHGRPYGRFTRGIVVLDNDHAKFARLSTGCYEDVLTHELGHAVGLAHVAATPSMMAPTLATDCVDRADALPLQPADRAALDEVYPLVPTAAGPPGAPGGLTAMVTGASVGLSWLPTGPAASSYRVIVGSVPGGSDLGQFVLGQAGVEIGNVARGVYYARVVALNGHGTSRPSAEVTVVVGHGLPGPPVGLMAAAGEHGDVRVLWQVPRGGGPVSGYVLLVGTAADRPTTRVPVTGTALHVTGVAPGTYFVRAIAVNDAGAGPATGEMLVVVP